MTVFVKPIILCGGNGTRLWPLSTSQIPKQFIEIDNKLNTLLDYTLDRTLKIMSMLQIQGFNSHVPLLVTNKYHQIPKLNFEVEYLFEEYANDTAVAVARVCEKVKNGADEKTILLFLPSDHYVDNIENFVNDVVSGIKKVKNDNIILYGLKPSGVETKYGHIIDNLGIVKFYEKPDYSTAKKLVESGALWNSGIFASTLNNLLNSLNQSKYDIFDWIINPRDGKAPSFDVAVLQQHSNIITQHSKGWGWSDVGTWESFINIPFIKSEMENDNNVILSETSLVNVLNRKNLGKIIIIGCKDLLVVRNHDDILIMNTTMENTNKLKNIVSSL